MPFTRFFSYSCDTFNCHETYVLECPEGSQIPEGCPGMWSNLSSSLHGQSFWFCPKCSKNLPRDIIKKLEENLDTTSPDPGPQHNHPPDKEGDITCERCIFDYPRMYSIDGTSNAHNHSDNSYYSECPGCIVTRQHDHSRGIDITNQSGVVFPRCQACPPPHNHPDPGFYSDCHQCIK